MKLILVVQFFVKTSKLKLIYFWKYELKTLKIWGMLAIGISYNHVLVKNKITGFLLFLLSLSLSLYIYIYPEKKKKKKRKKERKKEEEEEEEEEEEVV